jgi:hypothetical protein
MEVAEGGVMSKIFSTEDLISFAEDLRLAGFNFATHQYIAAQEVLVTLAANARLPADPHELKTWLAPVLCSSPKEQETFYQQFDIWLARNGFVPASPQPPETPGTRERKRSTVERMSAALRWLRRRPAYLLAAAFTLAALLLLTWSLRLSSNTLSGEVVNESGEPLKGALVTFSQRQTRSDEEGRFSIDFSRGDFPSALSVEYQDYLTAHTDVQTPPAGNLRITMRQPTPVRRTSDPLELTVPPSAVTVVVPPQTSWRLWLLWLVPLTPLLVLAAWLIRQARLRMFLKRVQVVERPLLERMVVRSASEQLFRSPLFRRSLQGLRRHRRQEAPELDPQQTVEATVARGGLYTPVAGRRTVSPEYVVLIDRLGFHDQQARLEGEMVNRSREEGVFVDHYYFNGDPRLCHDDLLPNHYLHLADLAALHHEHYLLIFSDGSSFMNPLTGTPEPWMEMLSSWRGCVLLTPERPTHWGYREAIMLDQNILVLPLNHDGLAGLAEFVVTGSVPPPRLNAAHAPPYSELLRQSPRRWLERHEPRPEIVRRLREQLRAYLGDDGYAWLCACAVHPLPQWELTLYLGRSLFGAREELEENLLALVRLPWFRQASMPDWLRSTLISDLAPARERDVRRALESLFINLIEQPDEGISIDFFRDDSGQHRGLAKLTRALKMWGRRLKRGGRLRTLFRAEQPNGPLRDYLFLNFMSGRRPGRLTVSLPQALRRILFPHGHSALGLRPAAACALAGVLALAGWYWVVRDGQTSTAPTERTLNAEAPSINITLLSAEYTWKLETFSVVVGRDGKSYGLSDYVKSLEPQLSTAEAIVCVGTASSDSVQASSDLRRNERLASIRMLTLASAVSEVNPRAQLYGLNLGEYRGGPPSAPSEQRRVIIFGIRQTGQKPYSKEVLRETLLKALNTLLDGADYSSFDLTDLSR